MTPRCATTQRQEPQTSKKILRVLALTLAIAMVAGSAGAALYTVTMTNGTSFETKYRPLQSEWDENQVMIMTDKGNWIALPKNEIADVESRAQASGYGFQLNTTTLFLGWSPNDVGDEDEEGDDKDGEGGTKPPGSGGGEEEAPIEYGDEEETPDYTFEQFLDVPDEGEALGGGISLDSGIDD